MSLKVLQSQLNANEINDLDAVVKQYQDDVLAWSSHMENVVKTAALPVGNINKFAPYPAPEVPQLISALIDQETGQLIPYEIIDDVTITPEMAEKLSQEETENKRQSLYRSVMEQEIALTNKVNNPAKIRLWNFQMGDILKKLGNIQAAMVTEMQARNEIAVPGSLLNASIKKLPKEEQEIYTNQKDRELNIEAIQRWSAQQYHDIADLTDEEVANWVMPEPPVLNKEVLKRAK